MSENSQSELDKRLRDAVLVAEIGHYSYYATRAGDIIIKKYGVVKSMRQHPTNSGYMSILINGRRKLVHRLVASAYLPNPESKPCVNHIDGDKRNNRVSNLEWLTYSANMLHASRTKLWSPLRGSANSNSKLTESLVQDIKHRLSKGARGTDLAREHGVAHSRIYDIKHGRSWAHVAARKAAGIEK